MEKTFLQMGIWRISLPLPPHLWQAELDRTAHRISKSLSFMTDEHHTIRNFVVSQLPGYGKPMPPEFIAESTNIPVKRTIKILDDLEKHKTFLFRNSDGDVHWAYPFTVDETPHHVILSTGERINAA